MNPLIPTVYSADPSAHIWPGDDRLWIYASHDCPDTNTHDTMCSYHVFSSMDLVNWTDYGIVLHLDDVSWAVSHMWAIDCVFWKGLYYLVFCAIEKGTRKFRTGLATSKAPQGPFKDIGYIQGVEHGQDPSLFVDEDGTPYLFWGYGKKCFGARLADDLRSAIPGTEVELTAQLKWVYEGPWVHKYQGKYYLSYPGLFEDQWPERMYYAIADKPLGPYQFKGEYIPVFPGQTGTNHGSILEYKNRWYAFHHGGWLPSPGGARSLMCDYLEYNPDGTIRPIVPSKEGVAAGEAKPGPSRVTILLGAEQGAGACGRLIGTTVATERPGYTGNGYVRGFDRPHYGVKVMVQQAVAAQYRLKIRYVAPEGDQINKLIVNDIQIDDPNSPDPRRYDKAIQFPKANDWTELEVGIVSLHRGDNYLRLYAGSGGIEVDYFKLEPV
jgi:Glycosyl hydrolases family 43/Carbohydrate binding module (family 35)